MFFKKHSVSLNTHGLQRRMVFPGQYDSALVERIAKSSHYTSYTAIYLMGRKPLPYALHSPLTPLIAWIMLGWSASKDLSHLFASDKPSHSRASLVRPVASKIEWFEWQRSPYYHQPFLVQCNGATWAPEIEFRRDAQTSGHLRRVRGAPYVHGGHNTWSIIRQITSVRASLRTYSVKRYFWRAKQSFHMSNRIICA